jgi:hypothetical protein
VVSSEYQTSAEDHAQRDGGEILRQVDEQADAQRRIHRRA